MRGDPDRAIEMLRQLEERKLTSLLRSLSASQRAVYEGRHDVALENAMHVITASSDPEAIYYVARNIAFFGDSRAIDALGRALDSGFVVYRVLLRHDPWFDPLRSSREFVALLDRSRETYRECLKAYEDAGAERLLGPAPAPEKLERCAYRSAPSLS
jgi:hypothetical protein